MKSVLVLFAVGVSSLGCKSTGSQASADLDSKIGANAAASAANAAPTPAGIPLNCEQANLPLRGFKYENAAAKRSLSFNADGKTLQHFDAAYNKRVHRVLNYSVTDGGLQCLITIQLSRKKVEQYFIGPEFKILRNANERLTLKRTTDPVPMANPVPLGSDLDCSKTILPLRGFEYVSRDQSLSITFLDDGHKALYHFRQPVAPGQGTVPEVVKVSYVNLGVTCGVEIERASLKVETYVVGPENKTLSSRDESVILIRTTDPVPM